MGVITLTTDFGLADGNVGVMKGVIWAIAPDTHIADLSHLVGPQNVRQAAWLLARSAPYFPQGTVHVVVVDPGVGTERRAIAVSLGPQRFVGPDNGVLTLLLERAEAEGWPVEAVHLDRPDYWLSDVSDVFHGRDIFSPVGAHLAAGVELKKVGSPLEPEALIRLEFPRPETKPYGLRGQVMHIDHFGNVATNIRREDLAGVERLTVHLREAEVPGLFRTFGQRPPGDIIALFGSTGSLILSVVNGSAAARLGAQVGDTVDVRWREPEA